MEDESGRPCGKRATEEGMRVSVKEGMDEIGANSMIEMCGKNVHVVPLISGIR